MEVCMSVKPDFTIMTLLELRAYVLANRDDEEALQTYIDKRHAENPETRVYQPEEDATEAITAYLKGKKIGSFLNFPIYFNG
jgi:hypothetical protein